MQDSGAPSGCREAHWVFSAHISKDPQSRELLEVIVGVRVCHWAIRRRHQSLSFSAFPALDLRLAVMIKYLWALAASFRLRVSIWLVAAVAPSRHSRHKRKVAGVASQGGMCLDGR